MVAVLALALLAWEAWEATLLLVQLLTARSARALLPGLAVALAVAAAGLALWGARQRMGWVVAAVLIASLLAWDAWAATSLFGRLLTPHRFLAGIEDTDHYLFYRRQPYYHNNWASQQLPEDALILYLGESRSLYLERARLVGGPIDPSPLLWLERRTGAPGFRKAVQTWGVTHVLVNRREMVRLAHEMDRYRGREEEAIALVLWLKEEAMPLPHLTDPLILYELPSREEPEPVGNGGT